MKTKLMILILGFFFNLEMNAQNYIYRGDKKFEATNSWEFSLNATYWTGNPEIRIAKNSSGGYLMISIKVPFSSDSIKGNLTIVLDDGTMIKCIDKGIRDYVDETSTSLYSLTLNEIEKMKYSKISKIRFNIYRNNGSYLKGEYKPYTASNYFVSDPFKSLNSFNSQDKDYYETDVEIANLFRD